MSSDNPLNPAIVFDTDSYAGNFEREMCAYITGQFGECGVGDDTAAKVSGDIVHREWWEDHITSEPDEHGCYRPVSIWESLDRSAYNSVAIFVDEFPPLDVFQEMVERAKAFVTWDSGKQFQMRPKQLLGFRFFQPVYRVDEVTPFTKGDVGWD